MREELQQVYKKLKNYVDRKVEEIPVSAGGGAAPIIFTQDMTTETITCNVSYEEAISDLTRPIVLRILVADIATMIMYPSSVQFGFPGENEDVLLIGIRIAGSESTLEYHPDGTICSSPID